MKKHILTGALLCLSILVCGQGTQLLRQPTISSESIVFVYANDLWKVSREGGDAVRLTSDEGYESSPHFSPDEQWIAFTAQYDGNTDVYVIPAKGGTPERLTWHPGGDFVQGWTPDGQVMFRSGREGHPTRLNKFYTVPLGGGIPKAVDIPRASFGELSEDGSQIAYIPITFWDPEWRNYRGGQAMPIWIVDMQSKELTRTPQPTQERHLDPIWFQNKVYYLSERDFASNIWMFDPKTGEEKQITFHKKFDVKSHDASKDAIVYEQGGYLHVLNPLTGQTSQLTINVQGDLNFSRTRWQEVEARNLSNANISPAGKRALFEYRGEVFTIPKENGSWKNLTKSSGVADRSPVWSPKGNEIAWFSDKSGEYQLVISDQDGGQQRSFSLPNPTFYFRPVWSPDGTHIAYTDTDYNIWIVNTKTGSSVKADTDRYAHPNRAMNPVWSPDSKWIAYAKQLESHFKAVFVHNVQSNQTLQLTDGMADAITPVWDLNGERIYLLASTDYGLNSGWLDMSSYDPQVNRSLYMILLNSNAASPVAPSSDDESATTDKPEEESSSSKKKKSRTKAESEPEKTITVNIEPTGINERIVPLKLDARNYTGLIQGPENTVFVLESVPNESGTKVHKYDVKKQEAKEFVSGVNSFTSNYNGEHVLFRKGSSWTLSESKSAPKNGEGKLKMDIQVKIDPKAEAKQIFREGWRYMRDFLYVDNVHGAPWDDVYSWYAPWIEHVRHRTDLNYVVDIMSGEVAIGHSYVSGGDMPDLETVPVGLLGCNLAITNGGLQITKIYLGENWNPELKAPLHMSGVKEGDYIVSVDGQMVDASVNPYSYFEQTSGRTIAIKVNSTPTAAGAKTILVEPVSSERGLRTRAWVEDNRRKVNTLSGGKLAYVYVPNTGGSGFTSFNRYYFAQQDMKGVVIDERNNGGGSAADYMIDIMVRTHFGYFNSKANDRRPWTTPMAGIWGPKVMLINERAGSGGDLLPYMFKEKGIGPLIGTRTWGGLVGTWDTPRFIDGGRMVAPRGGFYDTDGKWAVEGDGVAPDIEVIQEPKYVLQGRDPQLERGVEEALKLLEGNEFMIKPEPAPPVRWKRPEGFNE